MIPVVASLCSALAVLLAWPERRRPSGAVTRLVVGPWLRPGRWQRPRRARSAPAGSLPATLGLLAACLEAGLPLRLAVAELVADADDPLADDLRGVLARIEVGMPEPAAWRAVPPDSPWGAVAKEIARSLGSGTALAGALQRHAEEAAVEHEAAAQAAAKAVGVRSVLPLMACFLPAFLLVGVVPVVAGVALRLLG